MKGSDGHNQRQFTRDLPAKGERVEWSPDGSFLTYEAGNDIWVIRADGREPRNLTRSRGIEFGPTWSPDGQEVAFRPQRWGQAARVCDERRRIARPSRRRRPRRTTRPLLAVTSLAPRPASDVAVPATKGTATSSAPTSRDIPGRPLWDFRRE